MAKNKNKYQKTAKDLAFDREREHLRATIRKRDEEILRLKKGIKLTKDESGNDLKEKDQEWHFAHLHYVNRKVFFDSISNDGAYGFESVTTAKVWYNNHESELRRSYFASRYDWSTVEICKINYESICKIADQEDVASSNGYSINVPVDWIRIHKDIYIAEFNVIEVDRYTPHRNTVLAITETGFYYRHDPSCPVYYKKFSEIGKTVFEKKIQAEAEAVKRNKEIEAILNRERDKYGN